MSTIPARPLKASPHRTLQGARDIRLVRILRDTNCLRGLEVELSTTSLDDPTPYVALSYTWGAPEMERTTGYVPPVVYSPVTCGGGSVNVTENLLDFLKYMQQLKNTSDTYYWIDQISINQADQIEKPRQVAMMGDIYKAAKSVRVWLGKNDPSLEFLWVYESFIPSLLKLESKLRDQDIELHADSWDCTTPPELVVGLGAEVCRKWRESREAFFWFFYTRRWFLRAWILQEITLQDISVVYISCGKKEFSWEVLDAFTRAEKVVGPMVPLSNLLKGRRYVDMQAHGGEDLDRWKANFIWDIGPQNQDQIWYSILLHFLRTTRFMSAQDPRDHVYSLLGLMMEFLPPGMKCSILPNYGTSVVNVFKDVATQILENTPSLYLLSTVSYGLCDGKILNPGDTAYWPSWVPDFSNETRFAPSLSTTVYLVSSGSQRYNAARLDAVKYITPSVRSDVLVVQGARVNVIEKRNDRRRVISGAENLPFLVFILELCTRGASKYPNTDQTWIEAIWRTIMVDCIPCDWNAEPSVLFRSWLFEHLVRAIKFTGRKDGKSPHPESKEQMIRILQHIAQDPHLSLMLPTWEEVVRSAIDTVKQEDVEEHPFELLACESFTVGRWFLTNTGLLGSGPVSLIEGDEVWLLKGAKMPMILRKANDTQYRLVGESYIHGAMYGELITEELLMRMAPIEII